MFFFFSKKKKGKYRSGEQIINIRRFDSKLTVITSKQRPRKLKMYGSDGRTHMFLLKVVYQSFLCMCCCF